MEFKNTIWSEDIGNLKDWENEDGTPMTYDEATEMNAEYLDDERMNLDVAVDGQIICIADVGLWDGRRSGYKLMGSKISNILYSQMDCCISYCSWGSDGKDIVGEEAHHDGSNYYRYRILKGKTHDDQIDNVEKLYSKPLTERRIAYYTKSLLPEVSKIYGWK